MLTELAEVTGAELVWATYWRNRASCHGVIASRSAGRTNIETRMRTGKGRDRDEAESGMGLPKAPPRHHHPPGRWHLADLADRHPPLSEGYWGWALLTGGGAVANTGLAWFAHRRISA